MIKQLDPHKCGTHGVKAMGDDQTYWQFKAARGEVGGLMAMLGEAIAAMDRDAAASGIDGTKCGTIIHARNVMASLVANITNRKLAEVLDEAGERGE